MIHAVLDERLAVTIASERRLRYTSPTTEDRPEIVRAASALVTCRGWLVVIQDDASFLGMVDGDEVGSLAIPHAPHGRRRFEVALGNKLDKLDLEGCVVIDDELIAFGSGSIADVRDRICR